MRYAGLAWILGLLLSACADHSSHRVGEPEDVGASLENIPPLPADYFAPQAECMAAWNEIVADWKEGGGGIKDSILATRMQITLDYRSRFAAFVRRVWASQQDGRPLADLGLWPVSDKQFRRLSERVVFGPEDGIPSSCETLSWLDGLLWDEIASTNGGMPRPLDETPGEMEWTSPFVQQWVRYWLLVKLEPIR
jgi:hypothetical protein